MFQKTFRAWTVLIGLCLLALSSSAFANPQVSSPTAQTAREDIKKTLGFVPGFYKVMADAAVPGAWQQMKGLQLNPNTALSGKMKELIGLAVAAQVPCRYCVYAHTEFAKLNGASEAQVAEAVAIAGLERHFSAYLFGTQLDEAKFRADVTRLVQNAKKPARTQSPIAIVNAESALRDIQQTLGFVPELLRKIPEPALPGAWREMRDLKLNPNTQLSAPEKALIALAVASQVPSTPSVIAETEFARLGGASEREIAEAVGMAALTRNLSTMLNGQLVDEQGFRADIQRLVQAAKSASKSPAATRSPPATR